MSIVTLGLLGGLSWESTAIYYRRLNELARERLGGTHSAPLVLWSFDFAPIAALQAAGKWAEATRLLVEAARAVEAAGAGALVICSNTMHKMAEEVSAALRIPLLHIADATAVGCRHAGSRRPALLATRFTMEQDFLKARLRAQGIEVVVPQADDRAEIHRVIYEELCRGIVRPESKAFYLGVLDRLGQEGIDGVIFGCTEIGLLLEQADTELPVFDTTLLHCEAAFAHALGPA